MAISHDLSSMPSVAVRFREKRSGYSLRRSAAASSAAVTLVLNGGGERRLQAFIPYLISIQQGQTGLLFRCERLCIPDPLRLARFEGAQAWGILLILNASRQRRRKFNEGKAILVPYPFNMFGAYRPSAKNGMTCSEGRMTTSMS